jgi:hypothetical protein
MGGGAVSGETEIIDGDRVIMSGPRTSPFVAASEGERCLEDMDFGSRWERSSLDGFFFLGSGGKAKDPSISSKALAFAGKPFAIAEDAVCCDMESGTFDLS